MFADSSFVNPGATDSTLIKGLKNDGSGFYCMIRKDGKLGYGQGKTMREARKNAETAAKTRRQASY